MSKSSFPRYRYPLVLLLKLSWCALFGIRRSFHSDASELVRGISQVDIIGTLPGKIDLAHGCVITINHYSRKGFGIWWAAAVLSAMLPGEICWVITSAWNGSTQKPNRILHLLSAWIIPRIAKVYGMITMPPMPPRNSEIQKRSQSVRNIVRYMRTVQNPLLGYAPEGMDSSNGELATPPPGFGRLIHYLSTQGAVILPVGIFERDQALTIHLGQVYRLLDRNLGQAGNDAEYSRLIMEEIRHCLPALSVMIREETDFVAPHLVHP